MRQSICQKAIGQIHELEAMGVLEKTTRVLYYAEALRAVRNVENI